MKKEASSRNIITYFYKFFPITAIILLAVALRFYKLSELFHWTLDEEFWSYIPFNIATGYHIPLIGGHISGTGLYSGPLFVWFMSIPFFIFHGNPIGVASLVSLMGVITVAATYWAGKILFNKKTGLIASLLSASSFLMIIYDRKYWNASPIPLLSILTILGIYKLSRGKSNWAYILSISLAIAFHAHMTSGVLLLLVAASWFLLKLPIKKKEIYISIGIFLILQIPLVLFEFRHDFTNSKALTDFISKPKQKTSLFESTVDVGQLFLNTQARLIYMPANLDLKDELTLCPQYAQRRYKPPLWLAIVLIMPLLYLVIRKKSSAGKILFLTIGINILSLILYRTRAGGNWYPGQLSEYFFFPSFSAIFLLLARYTDEFSNKFKRGNIILAVIVTIFFVTNFIAIISTRHSNGYDKKQRAVAKALAQIGNEPFILEVEGDDECQIYGFRYIFTALGREPVKSYTDPQLNWLYERRLPKTRATRKVIIEQLENTLDLRVETISKN